MGEGGKRKGGKGGGREKRVFKRIEKRGSMREPGGGDSIRGEKNVSLREGKQGRKSRRWQGVW